MTDIKRSRNTELWDFEKEVTTNASESKVIVGVDGGATSTVCVCVAAPHTAYFHEPPPVLARAESSASNRNSVGDAVAKLVLERVLSNVLEKARRCRSAVQAVCLALSGVSSADDKQCFLEWLRLALGGIFPANVKLSVHNDSLAALASGTLGKLYGCVLVAGTGMIVFGVSEDGKTAQAAGVGPLLGESGSGYSIGQHALAVVMRAHDGRGPSTSLSKAILQKLELSSPEEIIGWMYKDYSWARVAAIVPIVKACASMGDPEAVKVLENAVEELAGSVKAVVERLNLAGEDGQKSFPLVVVGGVLENDHGWDLCSQLVYRIKEFCPNVQPIQPKTEPAVGAAMLAWYSIS
ncbi:hypothetical protein KP509_21G005700 [Ceratopteris richardii]|uniref:N-acetyl-D-glucosamine kinase n=1 Tax=Ceratopteris richardii TaxID=49495 RepID=A0A8T2S773_CERRI|nr:hypothetical protein KP509_21G005700 [Ceratopteris richardii]